MYLDFIFSTKASPSESFNATQRLQSHWSGFFAQSQEVHSVMSCGTSMGATTTGTCAEDHCHHSTPGVQPLTSWLAAMAMPRHGPSAPACRLKSWRCLLRKGGCPLVLSGEGTQCIRRLQNLDNEEDTEHEDPAETGKEEGSLREMQRHWDIPDAKLNLARENLRSDLYILCVT